MSGLCTAPGVNVFSLPLVIPRASSSQVSAASDRSGYNPTSRSRELLYYENLDMQSKMVEHVVKVQYRKVSSRRFGGKLYCYMHTISSAILVPQGFPCSCHHHSPPRRQ
jgi:hypothetical protein